MFFLQALDCVDELRGVDGKEGRQLVRELKYVESLEEDLEEKVVEVLQVEVLQVYRTMCECFRGNLDPRATIQLRMLS